MSESLLTELKYNGAIDYYEKALGVKFKTIPNLTINKDDDVDVALYRKSENLIKIHENHSHDDTSLYFNIFHELTHAYIHQEVGDREYKEQLHSLFERENLDNIDVQKYESLVLEEIVNEGLAMYIPCYLIWLSKQEGNSLGVSKIKYFNLEDIKNYLKSENLNQSSTELWKSSYRNHKIWR